MSVGGSKIKKTKDSSILRNRFLKRFIYDLKKIEINLLAEGMIIEKT